jgi:hypothetical protein
MVNFPKENGTDLGELPFHKGLQLRLRVLLPHEANKEEDGPCIGQKGTSTVEGRRHAKDQFCRWRALFVPSIPWRPCAVLQRGNRIPFYLIL